MVDLEKLQDAIPDITGKSYYWGKLAREAHDELAALRARVVDYERLLSGITENDDVQYDVWLTFCQQARARLARATESANHELVPCSHG
jgi:hypothetical protein